MSSKRISFVTISAAIIVIGSCIGGAGSIQAGTIYFDATSGDYAAPANWSGDALPVAADTAYIGYRLFTPASATMASDLSGTTVSTIRIGISGAGDLTLNSGGGLSYTWFVVADKESGYSAGTGAFTQNGGILNVSATTAAGGYYVGNIADCVGTHTMNDGMLNLGSSSRIGHAYVGHYGSGTFTMHGGDLNQANATSTFSLALRSGSTGIFNQDGGSVSLQKVYISEGPAGSEPGGAGTYVISDDGALAVNGTVKIGNRTGTGKFESQGSLASIEWKSTAALGANSTLSFVADSTGVSDILLSAASGTSLIINSAAQLSLDLSALSTAAVDLILIDNRGTDLISGMFLGYGEGYQFNLGDGSYYSLTYVYDASADLAYNDLALIAHPIPEPSTLALLGSGLMGLLAYAWRKRR